MQDEGEAKRPAAWLDHLPPGRRSWLESVAGVLASAAGRRSHEAHAIGTTVIRALLAAQRSAGTRPAAPRSRWLRWLPPGRRPGPSIVQYWDQAEPPADVLACMETWRKAARTVRRFDRASAAAWLAAHAEAMERAHYEAAWHPAMQSDLFRLSVLLREGGLYVDADDRLIDASRLPRPEPEGLVLLALAVVRGEIVAAEDALASPEPPEHVAFYVNNAPICAAPRHPVIERALRFAIENVEEAARRGERPDIHRDTGPTNLTFAAASCLLDELRGGPPVTLRLLTITECDWIAMFLPLDYKASNRNWRLAGA